MILGVFTLRQFMKIVLDLMLDFGPILIFVFVFQYTHNIFNATSIMMISTIIAVLSSYVRDKRIPLFAIFTSILVLFFGFLTIYFEAPFFIQVKDTIQDIIIASSFLISYLLGYPLLKKMFGHVLPISTHTYNIMTIN
ncbi:MAG: septation protein IspZ [Candidatus Pacebacteria bacterium]|nr:septation protein IspZ [Candidatus Paceibacterota bacterium]